MAPVAHHALLGAAILALWSASARIVARASAAGAMRAVGTSCVAAALAAAEALALGLAGLSGSAAALSAAAGATWLAAARALPVPEPSTRTELAAAWGRLGMAERVAAGVVAGVFAATCAWLLRWPLIGVDGLSYHLPTVIDWVRGGTIDSVVRSGYDVPTESYPGLNEAITAWGAGIASSFVVTTLWTPVALALSGVATWAATRELAVPPLPAGLATAVVVTLPLAALHLNEPNNDGPALTWIACSGALALGARRRPALAGPALVAAGLAAGTKTTALPLAVVAAGVALWPAREHWRAARPAIAAGAALALAVSLPWYLRNALQHGSPAWPFYPAPWGDDTPAFMRLFEHGLLDRPRATLRGHLGDYAAELGGAVVLMAGALLSPLLSRTRAVLAAAGLSALSLALWANAPVTGAIDFPALSYLTLSSLRYLLPALGVCALALALAARGPGHGARAAHLALAGALAWNLERIAASSFPAAPSVAFAAVGAVAGAGAALALGRGPALRALVRVPAPALAVAMGALLALPASGYVGRHLLLRANPAPQVMAALRADPRWTDGDGPVASTQLLNAAMAGDELSHRLELVGLHERCGRVRARLDGGWVLIRRFNGGRLPVPGRGRDLFPRVSSAGRCLRGVRPELTSSRWLLYGPQ